MNAYDLECALVRGGTSKGIFLDSRQLTENEELRERILLALFGSPDSRQINGLGGGDPLTSKVGLICPSAHPEADIDYRSGEVGIDEASINYSTLCGNLAAGAALFAHTTGMLDRTGLTESTDRIRIRNLNTGKFLGAKLTLDGADAVMLPAEEIDGVQGFGTPIELRFLDPQGPITGTLLPSGNALDTLSVNQQSLSVSIVDCGTLYAFVPATELGLTGSESPDSIDANTRVRENIEALRACVADLLSSKSGKAMRSKQIKIAVVNECSHRQGKGADILARVVNPYKTHKAYPVTGAVSLSAASMIAGTTVHRFIQNSGSKGKVRIAHPGGIIETTSSLKKGCVPEQIHYCTVTRSARVLLHGRAKVVINH